MHAVEPVGQAIGSCGLFEWAFGPRNPMKNWSSRIGGADPLVRGRRPRRPAGAPQDADVVVSCGTRGSPADPGGRPPGPAAAPPGGLRAPRKTLMWLCGAGGGRPAGPGGPAPPGPEGVVF